MGTIYTAQEDALPTGPLDDQFLTDTLNQGATPSPAPPAAPSTFCAGRT